LILFCVAFISNRACGWDVSVNNVGSVAGG
jgi:hypothetical protein